MYKTALGSGHLSTRGNPIQGESLLDIFLTELKGQTTSLSRRKDNFANWQWSWQKRVSTKMMESFTLTWGRRREGWENYIHGFRAKQGKAGTLNFVPSKNSMKM